jgi:hypothetical protein
MKFDASDGKRRSKKWDADSNRYALKLPQKPKPHCLICSGMAAFSFLVGASG